MTPQRDDTSRTENIFDYLSDLKDCPEKAPAPYEDFEVGGKSYYFTPGGSLYRMEPAGRKETGGHLCGFLTDEVWGYRTDDG